MNAYAYLLFNGRCEEAIRFYAQCTGGEIEMMMPHAGSPAEAQTPPEWIDKILHARLRIGDTLLMASDAPPGRQAEPGAFSVSLQVDTPEQAETCFRALSEGGQVRMPLQETFWARRFGMLVDRFGMPWMVNCALPA